jgi:hypothetical protein
MPGARKHPDFPLDDVAECNGTGTGRCTFPEITLGISFADLADERGFFRIAPRSSGQFGSEFRPAICGAKLQA